MFAGFVCKSTEYSTNMTELSHKRQEHNLDSSAVNVTNTCYINKVIFPSQMIFEIRVKQTLARHQAQRALASHEIARCALLVSLRSFSFSFASIVPFFFYSNTKACRGKHEYERCRRVACR